MKKAGMKSKKFGSTGKAMPAKKGAGKKKFNARKFNATKKAVFGMGVHKPKGY